MRCGGRTVLERRRRYVTFPVLQERNRYKGEMAPTWTKGQRVAEVRGASVSVQEHPWPWNTKGVFYYTEDSVQRRYVQYTGLSTLVYLTKPVPVSLSSFQSVSF